MRRAERKQWLAGGLALLVLISSPAGAINVIIDYSRDTNGFFGAGNPQGATSGAQAKAALDSIATYFSAILNDTFSAIVKPADFHSAQFSGMATWDWTASFTNPATGSSEVLMHPTIVANEYRIYAGARGLSGSTAGIGGPGGYGWSSNPTGGFSQAEINQLNATTDAFSNQVEHREETSGFASWGGAVTFDRDGSTTWHYNHTTAPVGSATDFYSVAVHELTHALGFAASDEFQALISGSFFFGSNAAASYGSAVPVTADGHWANNTMSTVYGAATAQEASMDPDVLNGTRKFFTNLDGAALKDIGWELIAPAPISPTGDYNGNGVVDAADYVLWRNTSGQNVTAGSGADGSGNGNVGSEDYTFWRTKFGLTVGSGSGNEFTSGGAVPEPTSVAIVILGSVWLGMVRSPRRSN